MSYSIKIAQCRNAFFDGVERGDAIVASHAAQAYVQLLREMYQKTEREADKTFLLGEIAWYEKVLCLIAYEGVSARVKTAILEGSKRRIEKKKPSTTPFQEADFSEDWVANVFERCIPATLIVKTTEGTGTGFFIDGDGLLITNHHVVYSATGKVNDNIWIRSGDEKISCKATLIASDENRDVALLRAKVEKGSVPFLTFISDYTRLRPGMDVMVIGNAFSFGLAPVSGTVKFPHSKGENDLIYTALTNFGDSGGPVFNRKGECVGVNKSVTVTVSRGTKTLKAQGLTNATPADEVKALIEKWKKEYQL